MASGASCSGHVLLGKGPGVEPGYPGQTLLPWEHFGVSPNKLDEVAGREGGVLPLRLKQKKLDGLIV